MHHFYININAWIDVHNKDSDITDNFFHKFEREKTGRKPVFLHKSVKQS